MVAPPTGVRGCLATALYTHKKLHNEVGLGGNVYSTQGQSCFRCSDWRYERVCLVRNRLLFSH